MNCGSREDIRRNIGVHGDVTGDRIGKVSEVMSFVGSVDDIWTKVVLSCAENTWSRVGDAGNVWNFGGAIRELSKTFSHFEFKCVVVADSDSYEDDGNLFELKEGLSG